MDSPLEADWYSPRGLAEAARKQLGAQYAVRHEYAFSVPTHEGASQRRVDAALFSSPVPSMNTAEIGFIRTRGTTSPDLSDYAYLGAPRFVVLLDDRTEVHRFRGGVTAGVPVSLRTDPASPDDWKREVLSHAVAKAQGPLFSDRQILLADTKAHFLRHVESIMRIASSQVGASDVEAFGLAISVVRALVLGDPASAPQQRSLRELHNELTQDLRGKLTMANMPPDAIAEMYESLAVSSHARRRGGVVYTPAWLARYAVGRLPKPHPDGGVVVDPTCGSGTFLVAYLERMLEQHHPEASATGTSEWLASSIAGMDHDPVAIEAARLSLDYLCLSIGEELPDWNLRLGDATSDCLVGSTLIGNFPFGYRTHGGNRDISSAILEHQHECNPSLSELSVILPDSLSYTAASVSTRRVLRERYRMVEVTRLPERAFPTVSAQTILLVAKKGGRTDDVLVREVGPRHLDSFRQGMYVSRSYTAPLPPDTGAPWRFSPFANEFEQAEAVGTRLGDHADVHLGLQVYGSDGAVESATTRSVGKSLLEDPRHFREWKPSCVRELRVLVASRDEIRRPGPWTRFPAPKLIVRSTTAPKAPDRLAAIPDYQGVFFTDKFVGVWPNEGTPDVRSLAAYFQTRFARAWFEVNNPSRKLRIKTLVTLPLPNLPESWWERAAGLVQADRLALKKAPSLASVAAPAHLFDKHHQLEWAWFNSVVEAAFGFGPTVGATLDHWLAEPNGKGD